MGGSATAHYRNPSDAIVNLTASAICGTDLHFIRGNLSGMQAGTKWETATIANTFPSAIEAFASGR
jgi:threonine dehydrogenase-like Zn-dependent dehydrogenase